MKQRFVIAMALYAVLAAGAVFLLDGTIRIAILVLLGGLAIKTCIALAAGW